MRHMKKIFIGLLVMLISLTATLSLFACGGASGNFEGKFVLDDVIVVGLEEDNPFGEFFEGAFNSTEMKQALKDIYMEFKADGAAVLGFEGDDDTQTLSYELKNGILTLKDSDGKGFSISGDDIEDMPEGMTLTNEIKYSGNKITFETKMKLEAQTGLDGFEITMQTIFKKA